jgi:AraC-like DNA-binding protein
MRRTSLRELQRQPPIRPDHGTRADRPITVLHDVWPHVGPGQYDMHYELELGIVLRGRMRRDHRGWRRTFSTGDLWLGGIWEPHAAFVLEAPLDLAILHIHPPLLAQLAFPGLPGFRPLALFTAAPQHRPHPLSAHRAEWLAFARRIVALAEDPSPAQPVRCLALLLDILASIAEHGGRLRDAPAGAADAYEDISRAIEAVLTSDCHVPVGVAARAAGMDRNLFSRRFQGLMGVSFRDFALRHRLGLAARMLRDTDLPLKAVADALGFTDKSHLHRHFVAVYGQTPLRYRRGSPSVQA